MPKGPILSVQCHLCLGKWVLERDKECYIPIIVGFSLWSPSLTLTPTGHDVCPWPLTMVSKRSPPAVCYPAVLSTAGGEFHFMWLQSSRTCWSSDFTKSDLKCTFLSLFIAVEAIVEFDYQAQHDDELTISVGEIITNIRKEDGGWWEGQINGRRGLFPDNFVRVSTKCKPFPVSGGFYWLKHGGTWGRISWTSRG